MFNYSWKIVVENIIFLTIFCQFSCTRQKAYLNGFILSRDSKFLGGPFMIKNLFWVNFQSFFGFNLFRLVFWVEDSLHIYIFLEMSFALASPFYCLPIFGDRLLYQTSGKFQSRLLEASFLVVNWNTFVWFQALVFDLRNFLCWYHIFGTSQIWSGCDVLT